MPSHRVVPCSPSLDLWYFLMLPVILWSTLWVYHPPVILYTSPSAQDDMPLDPVPFFSVPKIVLISLTNNLLYSQVFTHLCTRKLFWEWLLGNSSVSQFRSMYILKAISGVCAGNAEAVDSPFFLLSPMTPSPMSPSCLRINPYPIMPFLALTAQSQRSLRSDP